MATPQLSGSELDTAREAMHRLTYATTSLADPADSYALLAVLSAGLGSVRHALDQLATFHDRTADRATDTTGNRTAGHHAAAALHDAAALTGRAEARVDAAWAESGSIVWQPTPARSRGTGRPDP